MTTDLRIRERYDILLCPGIDSTAGGVDMRCRLCIRLTSRWTEQQRAVSARARTHLYDPAQIIDGRCHMLLLGHPDDTL